MQTEEIVQALAALPAATLYEGMGKVGAMSHRIRPMCPGTRLAGVAYTVRILGAETAAVMRAIEEAPAGSVLVIDTGDEGTAAVWGGTSSLASHVRGLAGCVTNGLVRDIDEMNEIGLPVYACGIAVAGTLKSHPGWIGLPVSVGGVVVHPGDCVIGDADGVVVVPRAMSEAAIAGGRKQRAKEEARDARIKAGEPLTQVLGLR